MKYFSKTRIDILMIGIIIFVLLPITGEVAHADSIITIHLDYKIILNPVTGARPPGVTNADIEQNVEDMNALLGSYWRGYRFVVDRITEIGGIGAETSRWYDVNFFNAPKDSAKSDLESAAEGNTGLYQWVQNAINMYITDGICGGISSFPPTDEIVIIGGCSAGNGQLQLHELGHYFALCHTQGCPCGGCDRVFDAPCICGNSSCVPANNSGLCSTTPGDDDIDDTLPDLTCWSIDQLSNWNYGSTYALLAPWQQRQVDIAASNNMGYNDDPPKCIPPVSTSEGQLDRWADAADINANRRQVRDGYTRFVSTSGSGSPNGTSTRPYGSVAAGVSAANNGGGDVLLLRPGAYNERITISKRVTLRAAHSGYVYIGTAAPLQKPGIDERLTRETTIELYDRLKAEDPTRFDSTGTTCGTVKDN